MASPHSSRNGVVNRQLFPRHHTDEAFNLFLEWSKILRVEARQKGGKKP